MENKVKTNNEKPSLENVKKNIMENLNCCIFIVPWQHLFFAFALEMNVHGASFFERGGMEGDHNLFVSNFITRFGFIEFSQEVY